jgi:hypothetical protein
MKPSKKPKIIAEESTSLFIFFTPLLVLICSILYILNGKSNSINNSIFIMLINCIFWITPILGFYNKKIILISNKVYIYVNNSKKFSLSFGINFKYLEFTQSKYGKIFNYGTLTLINTDNKIYQYFFLKNPEKIYNTIILTYEKNMKLLDKDYISTFYQNDETKILDSISNDK